MNSSIFSSNAISHKTYTRVFLGILGFLLLANAVSFVAFLVEPRAFYYRPWEYFEELAYRFERFDASWHQAETSDLSRSNWHFFQDPHVTNVTTDQDGYRSVPASDGPYEILVSGDSTIFGSGLSDSDTLPWLLSERLGQSVFNGGRSTLANTLKKSELDSVKIIIDARTERNVKGDFRPKGDGFPYTPLLRNNRQMLNDINQISPQRYWVTFTIARNIKRLMGDVLIYMNGGASKYLFMTHQMNEEDLADAVASIKSRSTKYEALGYRYIFMAVPAKQSVYGLSVDPYTKEYLAKLTDELQANDVETINLLPEFLAHAGEGLYRQYDTHWNEKGTALAAEVVAKHLKSSGL